MTDQRVTAADLAEVSIFAPLDESARAYLASQCILRSYAKGAFLFFQGEPADTLYIVMEGTVRVFQSLSDGREFTLEHLGPKEVLAAVCFFDGGPYPASTEALEPCLMAELRYETLHRLIESTPAVATAFLRMLSQRLRRAHARATDVAIRTVHERLAARLLHLDEERRRTGADSPYLPGRATDFALLIGSARETVTRALHDFERQGSVALQHGRVRVVDANKLAAWLRQEGEEA